MKVDRVILASNKNPMYYDFWNQLSFTYKEKFGIKPTLIFFGTQEELDEINLSTELFYNHQFLILNLGNIRGVYFILQNFLKTMFVR